MSFVFGHWTVTDVTVVFRLREGNPMFDKYYVADSSIPNTYKHLL